MLVLARFSHERAQDRRSLREAAGLVFLLALLLIPTACSSLSSRQEATPAPSWINAPPVENGYLYAIGHFHGALFPEDNLKYALEDARAKLADRLRAYIESASEVRIRGESERFSSDTRIETRGEVKNIEHIATWRDVDGVFGPKGQEWVLVRAPMAN